MQEKSGVKVSLFIISYVICMMVLFVNSSPLHDVSYYDSSVYITMGKAMLDGKVMYKDIFDHKGLYMYFINYIAALISGNSFAGLFIVEIIFMSVNAFLVFVICRRFYEDSSVKNSLITLILMVICIVNPFTLGGGNLTEEYNLPFQFLSIYMIMKYMQSDRPEHSPLMIFFHGIMVGISLNIRPNHVLMWIPIAVLILIRLLYHRKYRNIMLNLLTGLGGLAISILPVLIYAVVHDAVYDVIFGTFIYNFMYIDSSNIGIIKKFMAAFITNPRYIPITLAIILSCWVVIKNRSKIYWSFYFSMLLISMLSVALSGRAYDHYYMYVLPFIIPAVYKLSKFIIEKLSLVKTCILFATGIIILTGINYEKLLRMEKYHSDNDKGLYQFLSEMECTDKIVLEVGYRASFYVKMGVIPHEKYFYTPATPYNLFPDAVDAQADSVISCVNDFIILGSDGKYSFSKAGKWDKIHDVLENNYDVIYPEGAKINSGIKIYARRK